MRCQRMRWAGRKLRAHLRAPCSRCRCAGRVSLRSIASVAGGCAATHSSSSSERRSRCIASSRRFRRHPHAAVCSMIATALCATAVSVTCAGGASALARGRGGCGDTGACALARGLRAAALKLPARIRAQRALRRCRTRARSRLRPVGREQQFTPHAFSPPLTGGSATTGRYPTARSDGHLARLSALSLTRTLGPAAASEPSQSARVRCAAAAPKHANSPFAEACPLTSPACGRAGVRRAPRDRAIDAHRPRPANTRSGGDERTVAWCSPQRAARRIAPPAARSRDRHAGSRRVARPQRDGKESNNSGCGRVCGSVTWPRGARCRRRPILLARAARMMSHQHALLHTLRAWRHDAIAWQALSARHRQKGEAARPSRAPPPKQQPQTPRAWRSAAQPQRARGAGAPPAQRRCHLAP